jgi:hypothetical protein
MPSDQWLTLNDFSPGIHGDYHTGVEGNVAGGVNRNGAATLDSTFGCCADPSGALVPLPRVAAPGPTLTVPVVEGTFQPPAQRGFFLVDALAYGPVSDTSTWANSSSLAPDDENKEGRIGVAATYQFVAAPAGNGSPNYKRFILTRLWRQWLNAPDTRDIVFDCSPTLLSLFKTPVQILSGSIGQHRASAGDSLNAGDLHPGLHITQRLTFNRTALPTYAIPANELPLTTYDTDVSVQYTTAARQGNSMLVLHPDPAAPSGFNNWFYDKAYGASSFPDFMAFSIPHQGRIVSVCRVPRRSGSDFTMQDAVHYTATVDPAELAPDSFPGFLTQYGEENLSGIGALVSVTGSQLLIVKHRGGGYLVQGDLATPTVTRLPYIESTYGITAMAVATPIGVVYGSRNGIFAWNGGDTSTKLSAQIEGFFWNHTSAVEYEANRGRLEWWHPWVCVPNNFLFDTRTQSWWRLPVVNATPYSVYQVDPTSGRLLAFFHRVTSEQTSPWSAFDPAVLESTYSWKSQPLVETRERRQSFQQVRLVAIPGPHTDESTVTVTLTGIAENGTTVASRPVVFTFTGNGTGRPVIMTQDIESNFTAMFVQVQVSVDTDNAQVAPKIVSVELGYSQRQRQPKV